MSDFDLRLNSFHEYAKMNFRQEFIDARIHMHSLKLSLVCQPTELTNFFVSRGMLVSEEGSSMDDSCGIAFCHSGESKMGIVIWNGTGTQIKIDLHGVYAIINEVKRSLEENFEHSTSYINWVYDPQYLESMRMPLVSRKLPFDSMYPFLGDETLNEYYHRFDQSEASILLLIGKPGTGKTSFLRGLIQETGQNASLTYHEKILEQDGFFAQWFASVEENYLIIEDADKIIMPRTDGNSMMQRFLNLGDGLISRPSKKLIFTTNLESRSAIDPALLRPGRLHDLLTFEPLNRVQAQKVASDAGIEFDKEGSSFTIAEIFAGKDGQSKTSKAKSSFGFI